MRARHSSARMLRRARFEPGDDVLVVGVGGGTSTAAMLLARSARGRWVTSRDAAKPRWAAHHGATGGSRTSDPFDEQVRETDGRGWTSWSRTSAR